MESAAMRSDVMGDLHDPNEETVESGLMGHFKVGFTSKSLQLKVVSSKCRVGNNSIQLPNARAIPERTLTHSRSACRHAPTVRRTLQFGHLQRLLTAARSADIAVQAAAV